MCMFVRSPDAAHRAFAQARAPGIYKEDYLYEFFKYYNEEDETPAAPALPDWCTGQ